MEILKELSQIDRSKLTVEKRNEIIDALKVGREFALFEPSRSDVVDKWRLDFLREYLHPEDIPQRLDSQLDAICSKANIVAVGGGNGGGKSACLAIRMYIQATGEVPEFLKPYFPMELLPDRFPQFIRICCVSDSVLHDTILPIFKQFAPRHYLKKGSWDESWSSQHKRLELYKGNKHLANIEFKTYQQDVDTHSGANLDAVGFDEEPPFDIYDENRKRFRIAKRLFMFFSFTPVKGITWAYDIFLDEKESADNIETFKLSSVMNPKTHYKVLDEIFREYKGKPGRYDELRMKLLGDFVSLSGLIYGNMFNYNIHVIKPFKLNNNFVVYRGLDPHLAKPTVCVELAVDREGFKYVAGSYVSKQGATLNEVKRDLAERALERKYRLGWTQCDKSADSDIELFKINIFEELKRPPYAVPALGTSDKFWGSIHAGIDTIKKDLIVDEFLKKPHIMIFDLPENRPLIQAFRTLERDTYTNEDKKGLKDKILEGKHDHHACLRYIYQRRINWMPAYDVKPEWEPEERYV